jgi:ABC-type lipoprotein release transport system permease subunit
MKESQEGYERLGVQVADLITAVASVLQQTKQNEAFERVLQANVKGLFE